MICATEPERSVSKFRAVVWLLPVKPAMATLSMLETGGPPAPRVTSGVNHVSFEESFREERGLHDVRYAVARWKERKNLLCLRGKTGCVVIARPAHVERGLASERRIFVPHAEFIDDVRRQRGDQ